MFGDRLKEARLACNMTQTELSERIGVVKSTVAGYEVGRSEPDMSKMALIMAVLGVDANYLLQDEMQDSALSPQAIAIAHKFDRLDPYSQQIVRTVVDMELARPASEYERAAAAFASAMEDATPDSPAASAK
jgi:transcriptional regulator with XRE-family HTH domain